ncbi:hypothetical protein OG698_00355 [Streptomyces sp. NBC_01003]|uniref:hypothetical protein n=1 Tax=Streptomyces sp. NBC_01003 TaxID=2903714 RepID=UPI0038700105|nr:hypothetical protein OG698_00355 [Streptomyces sp. NBC_01003]
MADTSAIYALISGLGGAALGAGATVYVSIRQFRREIAERDKERSRLQAREEIVRLTSLRFAGRAWLDVVLRAKQNLDAGVAVDLEKFDQDVKEAGGAAAQQGYRVVLPDPSVEGLAAEISDGLSDLSWYLRREIIRTAEGGEPNRFNTLGILSTELGRLIQRRADLNAKLIERIEELALDAGAAIDQARPEA